MSDEDKRESPKAAALKAMSTQVKNTYGETRLTKYVSRIVDDMGSPMAEVCFNNIGNTAHAVMAAVRNLADDFAEKRFKSLLASRDVRVVPDYHLPDAILPASPSTSYGRTLFMAVDGPERDMYDLLANNQHIVWWHHVMDRRPGEFSINGFINHHPDLLAMRHDGALMAIETKGKHLKDDDTKPKLELGTRWTDTAGEGFQYSIVFLDTS